ncbi:MAG TPA: trypsin-like peptidase domain-containing protein [Planctomycetaceae bacterium]|nr:trypsin-like peptidase domain-containing protein [Planctomycetaceae bacterium]
MTRTMGQLIECACGKRLVIKESFLSGLIRCPGCGQLVDVENPAISVPGIHEKPTKRRKRAWKSDPLPYGMKLAAALSFTAFCFTVAGHMVKSYGKHSATVIEVTGTPPKMSPPVYAVDRGTSKDRDRSADERRSKALQSKTGRLDPENSGAADAKPKEPENDDDSRAAAQIGQLADLIEDVERCVVRLDVDCVRGKACGSGFVVDSGGTIVTNYHVVEQANAISATFNDKTKLIIEGFKYVLPEKDLAVLQTVRPNRPLPSLRFAKKIPRKGEKVVAFGSPLGLSFSASEGIVSGIRPAKELAEFGFNGSGTWIQMTTQISGGNSGGPLVSTRGEVVGVNTMSLTAGQNLNFAISCEDAQKAVEAAQGQQVTSLSPEKLPPAKGKTAPRPATEPDFDGTEEVHLVKSDLSPTEAARFKTLSQSVWFGVKWLDVSDFDARATRGLPSRSGVVVTEVAYRSPAYKAGLKVGDVIRSINGKAAAQSSIVEDLIDEFRPAQAVSLLIMRPESPGRYSRKEFTVNVEGLVSSKIIRQVDNPELPTEIRDFLKRQLLHYYATLADSIKAAAPQPARRNRNVGNSPPAGSLSVKELRETSPFDALFSPSFGRHVPVHVGNVGDLKLVEVLAVFGRKMVVARINRGLIALLADTANLVPGEYVSLGTAQILGTVVVDIPDTDRAIKIFVARPIVIDKYIPDVEPPKDE